MKTNRKKRWGFIRNVTWKVLPEENGIKLTVIGLQSPKSSSDFYLVRLSKEQGSPSELYSYKLRRDTFRRMNGVYIAEYPPLGWYERSPYRRAGQLAGLFIFFVPIVQIFFWAVSKLLNYYNNFSRGIAKFGFVLTFTFLYAYIWSLPPSGTMGIDFMFMAPFVFLSFVISSSMGMLSFDLNTFFKKNK